MTAIVIVIVISDSDEDTSRKIKYIIRKSIKSRQPKTEVELEEQNIWQNANYQK